MFPYYKKTDYRLTLLYTAMLLAVTAWCFMIVSVPLLADGPNSDKKIAGLITFFLSPACHQMADRCFQIAGHHLPVCSRCSGIYLGFLAGILIFPLFKKRYLSEVPSRKFLIYAALPLLLDVLLSKTGLWNSGLYIRFVTGLISGSAAVFYVLPPLNRIIAKKEVQND